MTGLFEVDHVLLRVLDALLHSDGNFLRFAGAEADLADAVADYDENAETEALTAFDDFADAVDGNYALRKLKAPAAVGFCILLCLFRHYIAPPLELQTGFAGSFRKGFDSAVIDMAAPVENDLRDSLSESAFCDELADGLCSFLVAGALYFVKLILNRRSGYERVSLYVIDDLHADMLQACEDRKTRTLSGAGEMSPEATVAELPHFVTTATTNQRPSPRLISWRRPYRLCGLHIRRRI